MRLQGQNLTASILLPQGRNGPAFLAFPNFNVFFEWNQSFVYVTTAAYFATRLQGAPVYDPGNPSPALGEGDMKALQKKAVRARPRRRRNRRNSGREDEGGSPEGADTPRIARRRLADARSAERALIQKISGRRGPMSLGRPCTPVTRKQSAVGREVPDGGQRRQNQQCSDEVAHLEKSPRTHTKPPRDFGDCGQNRAARWQSTRLCRLIPVNTPVPKRKLRTPVGDREWQPLREAKGRGAESAFRPV